MGHQYHDPRATAALASQTAKAVTAKHTPGPWRTQSFADGTEGVIARDGGSNVEVATCRKLFAKANARLIAAAPEMFEALERIVSNLEIDPDWPDNAVLTIRVGRSEQFVATLGDMRRASAALAKAKGRA